MAEMSNGTAEKRISTEAETAEKVQKPVDGAASAAEGTAKAGSADESGESLNRNGSDALFNRLKKDFDGAERLLRKEEAQPEPRDDEDDSDMKICGGSAASGFSSDFDGLDEAASGEKLPDNAEKVRLFSGEISENYRKSTGLSEPSAEEAQNLSEKIREAERQHRLNGGEKAAESAEELPGAEKETLDVGGTALAESAEADAQNDESDAESDTESDAGSDAESDIESGAESGGHGHIFIDDEKLRTAFDEDGYALGKGKERRKKKRNAAFDGGDAGEPAKDETASDEYSGAPEKRARYDENGERIARESVFFTPKLEYTKGSDPETIVSYLSSKLLGSFLCGAGVLILFFACLYFELAPGLRLPHPKVFEFGKTGVIYLLFDLQLMFAAVILKLNSICKGASALFRRIPSAESAAFISVVAATVHTVALILGNPSGNQHGALLSSIACLSILLLAINDFFRARMEYMSFRIISTDGDKLSFKNLSESGESTPDEISKFVPEGSRILDVRKVGFSDGFFSKFAKPVASDKKVSVLLCIALAVSAVAAAVYCVINKEPAYQAFCNFASILIVTAQPCMIISSTMPEFILADRAARRKCAFVGYNICEEFENVSVVSFKDTEVFPPKDIKVTNIRTYGDTRIDNVIVMMARIFGNIGGSLSAVFTNSISGINFEDDSLKMVDIAPDGLWLKVDGENVYVGTSSYMYENNFDINAEPADDSFRQQNGGILYLASSERVLAKFYIKYTLNPDFEAVLRTLYTQNICARIKTLDPCINNDFIRASLRRPECLFSVVKSTSEDMEKEERSLSSGIVSASGESTLIQSFLFVRKMKSSIRANGMLRASSTILILMLAVFALFGGSLLLPAAVMLILHLFFVVIMSALTNIMTK